MVAPLSTNAACPSKRWHVIDRSETLQIPSSSISSAVGPDALAGGRAESVVLEVCRGRTEHPLRPVHSERFLIGSSPRCDLRLGGEDMPPLHSLIVIDGTDVWLEAVAPRPHLVVNDRPQSSVRLADGDHIRVG